VNIEFRSPEQETKTSATRATHSNKQPAASDSSLFHPLPRFYYFYILFDLTINFSGSLRNFARS
jgi:hypothetical protein